jgi:hypothetical protein
MNATFAQRTYLYDLRLKLGQNTKDIRDMTTEECSRGISLAKRELATMGVDEENTQDKVEYTP